MKNFEEKDLSTFYTLWHFFQPGCPSVHRNSTQACCTCGCTLRNSLCCVGHRNHGSWSDVPHPGETNDHCLHLGDTEQGENSCKNNWQKYFKHKTYQVYTIIQFNVYVHIKSQYLSVLSKSLPHHSCSWSLASMSSLWGQGSSCSSQGGL